MFRNIVNAVVFVAGLAAVLWIGAGYLGTNLLGVAVTALIAACYLAGALELLRYRQASAQLAQALASTATAGSAGLEPWLQGLPAALRPSVRLRIEGERAALPAPVLAPYLVGLLVLLGMLGTLLGMMATLRGTGIALESASDLDAIRGSLGAPVKGLAFAFGTSIAGVASSAMLGLLASLCRRERMQLVQQLDRQIAGELRPYTRAHQREQSLHLLQQQAAAMPALVDRLQAMITAIDQHSGQLNAQLLERQQQFHERSEAGHRQLAVAIEQSLQSSVAASAQAVSQALQPLVHDTMATIAGQTTALHDALGAAVQRQLDGVQAGVERSTVAAGDSWKAALAGQQQANQTLTSTLHGALDTFNQRFEQRSGHLLETLAGSLAAASASTAASWEQALARQQALNDELSQHHQQALAGAATTLEQHSATLLAQLQQRQHEQQARNDELGQRQQQAWARAAEAVHGQSTAMLAQWQQSQAAQQALNAELSQHQQQALLAATAALDTQSTALIAQLRQTHSEQQALNAELSQHQQQAWVAATSTLDGHSTALIARLQQSHSELQATLEARDEQRLAHWGERLEAVEQRLGEHWQRGAEQIQQQQREICQTLAHTAQQTSAQSQAQAQATLEQIGKLVQSASEAPRAAAEVIAELRQTLSESMVRDTAMLEERSRLLATLQTLLDAVNHASTEQRSAIDALVTTSADLLERVGSRFSVQLDAETGKLGAVAAQVNGSAIEVASLGQTLGVAVELFGQSNQALMERLQAVAEGLDKSLLRSDEQLAYYVAQAREVVDLSMLSQKQIIAELQQLAGRAPAAATAGA